MPISALGDFSKEAPSETTTLSRLRRIGERLSGEFRQLLDSVPAEHRSISSLSRWLDENRAMCHRFVVAAKEHADPTATLMNLPGVEGLRQIVSAFERQRANVSLVAAGHAAVQSYAELIGEFGGSQAKLVRAIEDLLRNERLQTDEDPGDVAHREMLYESASRICGFDSETRFMLFISRPLADNPDLVDTVQLYGHHQARCAERHMPIVNIQQTDISHGNAPNTTFSGEPAVGRTPGILLPAFSSDPLPEITSRPEGNRVVHVIDRAAGTGVFDLALAQHFTHNLGRNSPLRGHQTGSIQRLPARNLLIDVYFHRSIAIDAERVSAGVYYIGNSLVIGDPSSRWYDRVQDVPRLNPIDDPVRLACEAYPRMSELTAYGFEKFGADPSQYAGWRFEVRYPLWTMQYLLTFLFK